MIDWKRVADTIQAATNLILFYTFIVVLGLVLIAAHGCAKVSGGSIHKVEGDATIHIVIGVDTAVCDELPAEDRLDCIEAIVELAKSLPEDDEPQTGFGGIR